MQEQQVAHGGSAARRTTPSSSRMVARYLTDVEELLGEQRWEAARREAFDLPRIAVALTDPKLRTCPEEQRSWCERWIRAGGGTADVQAPDYERVRQVVSEHLAHEDAGGARSSVPVRALRRLRLRRHVRTAPRGFCPQCTRPSDPSISETAQICAALVEAVRRWYAQSGCHDTTVQGNLARLAVLR
jgi:hypothetical protein